ncbi:MAG: metal ABC transporter solute-binding protein, Zn/Mn family [Gammaproteobacteria bacterium]
MKLFPSTSCLLLLLCLSIGAQAGQLRVFVSVAPQKFLVERIGGDTVDVRLMLQPGHSPELYEPLPGQLAALEQADIYFRIGVPFEEHWREQLRSTGDLTVVNCCDDPPGATEADPHVWTSPPYMMRLAGLIKQHLQQQRPQHRALYERNHDGLLTDLESLHQYIRQQLWQRSKSSVFVVHPSWGHFAEAYNLQQHALERHHGHVGIRGMVELVRLARQEKASVLFSQRQYHLASAATFADEINAEIVMLDPLAEDYLNNMRYVARQFARAVQ